MKTLLTSIVLCMSVAALCKEPVKQEKVEESDAIKAENLALRFANLDLSCRLSDDFRKLSSDRDSFNLGLKLKYKLNGTDSIDWKEHRVVRAANAARTK